MASASSGTEGEWFGRAGVEVSGVEMSGTSAGEPSASSWGPAFVFNNLRAGYCYSPSSRSTASTQHSDSDRRASAITDRADAPVRSGSSCLAGRWLIVLHVVAGQTMEGIKSTLQPREIPAPVPHPENEDVALSQLVHDPIWGDDHLAVTAAGELRHGATRVRVGLQSQDGITDLLRQPFSGGGSAFGGEPIGDR